MSAALDTERDARLEFWRSTLKSYVDSRPLDVETRIRDAQDAYVAGHIDVETLEFRIEAALFGARSPQP